MDLGAKIRLILNIWAKQIGLSPMLLLAPKSFPRHCSCWFSQVFYVFLLHVFSCSGFLGIFQVSRFFLISKLFLPHTSLFPAGCICKIPTCLDSRSPWTGVWWNNWYCCANILHFRFAPNPPKWAVTFPLKTDTICDGQSSGVHLLYKVQLPWENTPWQKKPTLLMM